MPIQDLVGFELVSCSFTLSTYSFVFFGQIDNEYKRFDVQTQFYFSILGEDLIDAEQEFSSKIWNCLERKVVSIKEYNSIESPRVIFGFEGDIDFVVWWDKPLFDNLLLVFERDSDNWYTVL